MQNCHTLWAYANFFSISCVCVVWCWGWGFVGTLLLLSQFLYSCYRSFMSWHAFKLTSHPRGECCVQDTHRQTHTRTHIHAHTFQSSCTQRKTCGESLRRRTGRKVTGLSGRRVVKELVGQSDELGYTVDHISDLMYGNKQDQPFFTSYVIIFTRTPNGLLYYNKPCQ